MKASTHTEIYRPFEGELRRHPLRFLTIMWSSVRLGFKRKLPALLLFTPPAVLAIVFSFLVHLKFAAESGFGMTGMGSAEAGVAATMMGRLLEVTAMIVQYVTRVSFFALLACTWYGAGSIAEDRRMGAHLLYFSRPITRFDYFLGKFCATAYYGACALLAPALVICSVAAFSSPNWSFVTEQGDVILKTLGYCLLWITTVTAIVLAVSSVVDRKTHALVGTFGLVFLSEAVGRVLEVITDEPRWALLRLSQNFSKIAVWMFDPDEHEWAVSSSFIAIGAVLALALAIIAQRLRRMEVVA